MGSLEVPDVNQKVLTGRLGRSWADTRLESTGFPLTRWETQEAVRDTGSGERHRKLGDTGSG